MRRLLILPALAALASAAAVPEYPVVRPGITLAFPRDHGAHPAFRTEWWYVTGQIAGTDRRPIGFQITFFRTTPRIAGNNPSHFAPRQILFAHAALSDPAIGHLLHEERAARAGFGLAQARLGDADVSIRDWRLRRLGDGRFVARVTVKDAALSLVFTPTQAVLPQGEGGYSRKGPRPEQASYYYSLPQLRVSGSLSRKGNSVAVSGKAWLDREWSSDYLAEGAVGWDWAGINLDDGGALMAARIRGADGRKLWGVGSYRRADGRITVFAPGDVSFTPLALWRSPHTGARYPVAQRLTVRLPEGVKSWDLRPLFADQELDARRGGQPVYWEGAVRTRGGQGYLELTGYADRLRM